MLVGRAEQVAALRVALDEVAAGDAPIAWLEGDPGIGKSVLWEAATREAHERGFRVLAARPAEPEADLGFAGLAELLSDLDDATFDCLPATQRQALLNALFRGDDCGVPGPEIGTHVVFAAFTTLVRALAASGPVTVAVDDSQWLDPTSAKALAFAFRRVAGRPVGLVAAARPGSAGPLTSLARSIEPGRFRTIAVGPMPIGAFHHLLADIAGVVLPRPQLVRLHAQTAGNPLFALEIARTLASGHAVSVESLSGEVQPLLASRLGSLSPRARSAVRIAALAARPTPALLSAVLDDPDLSGVLVELERAGVLVESAGVLTFGHPMLATSVVADLGPAERRALHLRLSRLIDEPEERATHLVRATTEPDPGVAEEVEAAALRAARRGAKDVAGELLERAAALTPDTDRRDLNRRLTVAGYRHFVSGDVRRAEPLLQKVVDTEPPGPLRAGAAATLGGARDLHGDSAAARRLFKLAIDDLEGDDWIAANVLVAATKIELHNDIEAAGARAAVAVGVARATGDDAFVNASEQAVAYVDFLSGNGVDLVAARRRADADARMTIGCTASWFLAAMLLATDAHDEARAILVRLADKALHQGDVPSARDVERHLLELALRAGRLDEAEEWLSALEELAVADAEHTTVTEPLHAVIAVRRGRHQEARSRAAAALAHARAGDHRTEVLWAEWASGVVALASGDPEAATTHLVEAAASAEAIGLRDPGVVPFHADLLDALLAAGRLEEAAGAAGELGSLGLRLDRPRALAVAARGQGLVLACRGDLPEALGHLERAVAHHDRLDDPFERARTLLALGGVRRRSRQKRAAGEALTEARTVFESVGAVDWVKRSDDELARVGSRPGESRLLTPTERQIAELVGEGLTNREIGTRLSVSVRTVESNLTRVYRKLAVRSRTELVAELRSGAEKGVVLTDSGGRLAP